MARNSYHDSLLEIVPGFTSFIEDFLIHHRPNLRSLFQRDVRAHASPGPLDSVKGCNQLGMSCVGSSSFISFSVCWTSAFRGLLVRVCLHRCPHACLARRVVIGSVDASDSPEDFDWSVGLHVEAEAAADRWWQSWYNEKDKIIHFSRNCLSMFGQSWSSHFFSSRMNIRVLSKAYQAVELLAFLRVTALSRTDRDREHTLVPPRLFAFFEVPTVVGFLELRKVSISSELKSFLLSMCIEAPESTTNIRSSVVGY